MNKPDNRYAKLVAILETFISKIANVDVRYGIEENIFFRAYSFLPMNSKKCPIVVVLGKCYPYFLNVEIGKKYRYEEYEGLALPAVNYLYDLMESVFYGKVVEKRNFIFGLDVGYSIKIELTEFDNVDYENKPILLFKSISDEVVYKYIPWWVDKSDIYGPEFI